MLLQIFSKMLRKIFSNSENGWLDVVLACVEVIPIGSDLGPAVISILLDECSLAPKVINYDPDGLSLKKPLQGYIQQILLKK